MSVAAVARQYAHAIADVAVANNNVDSVERDMRALATIVRNQEEIRDLLASPVVSHENKRTVLQSLIDDVGPGATTVNLLNVLLRNYRLQYLPEIYDEFKRVMNERRGIVVASVTTAAAISPDQQAALTNKLERVTGKKIEFAFTSDPSLIGGVVTRIGSVVYDGSIKTQLEQIKRRMKKN
jgi:F-type H+-transporting ATPase subunit delta